MLGCRGLEPGTLGAPGAALDKLPGKGCKGEKAWGGVGGQAGRRAMASTPLPAWGPPYRPHVLSLLPCPTIPALPRYPCPTEQV